MKNSELGFDGLGIALSSKQKELLGVYIEELTAWNRHMNLTGLSSTQRIINELVADSLMPATYLPDKGLLLDVGSGAGFPAIPLKICKPKMRFFLLEPNSKKGSFLKQVIRLCELKEIEVVKERIEKSSRCLPFAKYDIITSRAMAPLPQLIRWCTPYLATDGLMLAFLGNRFEDILEECEPLLEEWGLFVHDSKPYMLEGKDLKRNLLVLKKLET